MQRIELRFIYNQQRNDRKNAHKRKRQNPLIHSLPFNIFILPM